MDLQTLQEFHLKASLNTYIGGATSISNPQRPEFEELVFEEGNLSYRDSYCGSINSWGTEVIRENNIPVWCAQYGGGMTEGKESLAGETYRFLKLAMSQKPQQFSARGPELYTNGDFKYEYNQKGDFKHFNGLEKIYYKDQLVHEYRVIGGIVS